MIICRYIFGTVPDKDNAEGVRAILKLKNKKQACDDLTKSSELGYVDANAELTKNCKSPKKLKTKK